MDRTAPAISVITIVKNNEQLLPRAVDSVVGQTFPDFEYIIVNDGSTDGTTAVIDEYAAADSRIIPLHMSSNVGRALARNAGMDSARGRYLFFLDSDDYLPSTALMDLYKVAEEHGSDIVYGRIKSFDQAKGYWLPSHYTDRIVQIERHNFCLDDHLDLVDNHQIVGRLFRREMLKRNDLKFSLTRKNGEDVLFAFFTAFYARKLSMVPQYTVYFYCLGNYLGTANESKLVDARDNVLETLDFAVRNGTKRLKDRMLRKGVIFAGSLERVQAVYQGDVEKIKKFLATLVPLVSDVPDSILDDLPQYYQKFTRALQSHDFSKAYTLWIRKTKHYVEGENRVSKEIEKLKRANQLLAYQLDAVYNSTSWRITAPLRRVSQILAGKKRGLAPASTHSAASVPTRDVILQPGLDLSLELEGSGYGMHRSGWKAVAMESLLPLHSTEAVYFVSFLEKVFLWGEPKPVSFPKPWIGVTHRPHNIPSWLPAEMRRQFYQSEYFPDTLPGCLGLFTLSRYHARHIREMVPVPVESLTLPTEIPDRQWDPESVAKQRLKVVQVGWWLRKLHGIFILPSGEYDKIYLTKRQVEPVDRYFAREAEHLKRTGEFNDSMYDSARTVDYLSNDEYDELFSSCVVFLDLYDASANNVVVESIARATPLLVNPLEPVREYLGEEYPLYYNSYEEAVAKLHDADVLIAAHEYLKRCPTREKLSGAYFRKSLVESSVYRNIPC